MLITFRGEGRIGQRKAGGVASLTKYEKQVHKPVKFKEFGKK
jgi:hypothetical protein